MCRACSKSQTCIDLDTSIRSISSTDLEVTDNSSLESSSTSSTESKDGTTLPLAVHKPTESPVSLKKTPRMRKSVRFASPSRDKTDDMDIPSIHNNNSNCTKQYPVRTDIIDLLTPASSMSEVDRANSYWQLKDYEYFRGTAQIIATEVLKVTNSQPPSSHSYNNVLTRAYDLCAIVSEASYSNTEAGQTKKSSASSEKVKSPSSTTTSSMEPQEKEEDGVILPPHLFAALTHWVKAGHSRRGLEKFCVTSHIRTRPMAKAATVQAVLLAQDLLRQQAEKKQEQELAHSNTPRSQTAPAPESPKKFHIGTCEFPLEDVPQDEILRLVSERFSKTSRYYSTSIGHADAAAIGNYEHPMKK